MSSESTAPADGNLRGGKVSNGDTRIVQRQSGPRHVREILPAVVWKLLIAREAERAKVQP
jgi:hypothetical protein